MGFLSPSPAQSRLGILEFCGKGVPEDGMRELCLCLEPAEGIYSLRALICFFLAFFFSFFYHRKRRNFTKGGGDPTPVSRWCGGT